MANKYYQINAPWKNDKSDMLDKLLIECGKNKKLEKIILDTMCYPRWIRHDYKSVARRVK